MAITLTIGGVSKTPLSKSINISDELNTRNTCAFSLVDVAGTYHPAEGAEVIFLDGVTRNFAGTIDSLIETKIKGNVALSYNIRCVDYNQICDRHIVTAAYTAQTLLQIVTNINSNYLVGEAITLTNVQTGPTLEEVRFNGQNVTQCFNELAELIGYSWYIDYNKDLHFFARETNLAPFAITDTSANFLTMKITTTREQYRNVQYLIAGEDVADAKTESFIGDGTRKTYSLSLKVAKVPSSVTVNGVAKTIGIRGVDTGKDWYWSKDEKEISQSDSAAALTSVQTLAVTYQGLIPIKVQSRLEDEITARVAAEGGSGIYEAIEEDPRAETQDLALDKSNGLLRRFGKIPRIVEIETDTPGLKAGQLININITPHAINGDFLIDRVTMRDVDGKHIRYMARCLDGERLGGWVEFFQKLALAGRKYIIRENEVLVLLKTFSDNVICGDTFATPTTAAPESRVGYAIVGYSEVE